MAKYLAILARNPYVERIFIFDLLCGEGIYEKGEKGSPIMALETIGDHYYSNNQSCPNITVWFNDIGKSEIEPEVLKIDRVKDLEKKFTALKMLMLSSSKKIMKIFFQEPFN